MDTLTPAVAAWKKTGQEGADMQTALVQMKKDCREWKRFHEGYDSKIRTCQQTWGNGQEVYWMPGLYPAVSCFRALQTV